MTYWKKPIHFLSISRIERNADVPVFGEWVFTLLKMINGTARLRHSALRTMLFLYGWPAGHLGGLPIIPLLMPKTGSESSFFFFCGQSFFDWASSVCMTCRGSSLNCSKTQWEERGCSAWLPLSWSESEGQRRAQPPPQTCQSCRHRAAPHRNVTGQKKKHQLADCLHFFGG